MIILGVDPGITKIGVSVVDWNTRELLYYKLHEGSTQGETVNDKSINSLVKLDGEFQELLDHYKVERVVVELVPSFGQMSQQSRILVVQNLLRVISFYRKLEYIEIAPLSVKKRFTGNGKASKKDIKAEVLRRYPQLETEKLEFDVYDAIAITLLGGEMEVEKIWKFGQEKVDVV